MIPELPTCLAACAAGSMLQLECAWLLSQPCPQLFRSHLVPSCLPGSGRSWIEAVEDQQVPFRIVHRGKGGHPRDPITRSQGIHFVVFELIPRHVPAWPVELDLVLQFQRTEVVADTRHACH